MYLATQGPQELGKNVTKQDPFYCMYLNFRMQQCFIGQWSQILNLVLFPNLVHALFPLLIPSRPCRLQLSYTRTFVCFQGRRRVKSTFTTSITWWHYLLVPRNCMPRQRWRRPSWWSVATWYRLDAGRSAMTAILGEWSTPCAIYSGAESNSPTSLFSFGVQEL